MIRGVINEQEICIPPDPICSYDEEYDWHPETESISPISYASPPLDPAQIEEADTQYIEPVAYAIFSTPLDRSGKEKIFALLDLPAAEQKLLEYLGSGGSSEEDVVEAFISIYERLYLYEMGYQDLPEMAEKCRELREEIRARLEKLGALAEAIAEKLAEIEGRYARVDIPVIENLRNLPLPIITEEENATLRLECFKNEENDQKNTAVNVEKGKEKEPETSSADFRERKTALPPQPPTNAGSAQYGDSKIEEIDQRLSFDKLQQALIELVFRFYQKCIERVLASLFKSQPGEVTRG
jgi:hypothetical protein